jgi:activator of HSP90 ATPase
MTIQFQISTVLPASPDEVYRAWLSSEGHTHMTGSSANITPRPGVEFEAWDGYITGRNLELEPGRRIVQAWRTTEFADDEPDSRVEVILEPEGEKTRLTLRHTGLPEGGEQYEQGWIDNYFEPMLDYFIGKNGKE